MRTFFAPWTRHRVLKYCVEKTSLRLGIEDAGSQNRHEKAVGNKTAAVKLTPIGEKITQSSTRNNDSLDP